MSYVFIINKHPYKTSHIPHTYQKIPNRILNQHNNNSNNKTIPKNTKNIHRKQKNKLYNTKTNNNKKEYPTIKTTYKNTKSHPPQNTLHQLEEAKKTNNKKTP
jgi:hypothetical protein